MVRMYKKVTLKLDTVNRLNEIKEKNKLESINKTIKAMIKRLEELKEK
jgi:hypothetical protein